MQGRSETVFAPNANLSRAELVVVLYRMAGSPSVEDQTHPFTDVADGTWYADAVTWAYRAKVVKGVTDTTFVPTANVTREQIAATLFRFDGEQKVEENALEGFTDANMVSTYAEEAMNWAVCNGLIKGMNGTTLAPQGNAARVQIATVLMRYCEG